MLRNKNLIPLSHQHQKALALCVRIDRAAPVAEADLDAWQSEISQHFRSEIAVHFAAEEQAVFPLARNFEGLTLLIDELLADHLWLRERFAAADARSLPSADLPAFAQRLSAHIRKEERRLFERLQELMSEKELSLLGSQLEQALKHAEQACILPAAATRSRSAK